MEKNVIVKHLNSVESERVEMEGAVGVSVRKPITSADGTPAYSFRVFTIEAGGATPYHTHAWEHLNYIIKGRGALVDADGTEHPVEQGDFAMVLPDEKHCYKNTADDADLVMICAVPKENE